MLVLAALARRRGAERAAAGARRGPDGDVRAARRDARRHGLAERGHVARQARPRPVHAHVRAERRCGRGSARARPRAAAAAGWTPTAKPSERGFVAEKRASSGRLELAVVRFRDALLLPADVKPPALQISLRHRRRRSSYRPAVAVATNEFGLFINGETVEGSSVPRPDRAGLGRGARHGAARGRGGDRPRGRGRPRRARRRLGQDARERAVAAPARARRRRQGEPERALRARGAQRRQGDLLDQGGALRRGRELPLLRLRDRLDRRPLEPDRRLAPLLHVEGAGRRRGPDRPLELPAADDDVEARAGARGRLCGRAQARSADAGDRAQARRARGRGRLSRWRDQHRHRRRADDRRLSRQASGRRQDRVHRLDEDGRRDHAALLGADQAADAGAGRQEPQPRLRRRRPRLRDPERGLVDLLLGRPELRGALPRPRRAARSTTTSSRRSRRRPGS